MTDTPATVRPSVLVIDDESGILETLEILLRNEGFAPHVALGGRAGLEKIATVSPDIVLTDVRMPQVGGVEVLAAARANDPDTPVILMTAQATLQSAMQAVNEGAFYYIQKPFRNDELVAILRRAAEHRSLRVEITKRNRRTRDFKIGLQFRFGPRRTHNNASELPKAQQQSLGARKSVVAGGEVDNFADHEAAEL